MNPDLLLGSCDRACGLCPEDDTCLRGVSGLELAGRFSRPEIHGLVEFSLRDGSVLALAGEWRSCRGKNGCQLTRLVVAQPVSTVGALQIPGSWAFPLGVALRVIGIAYLLVLSYMLVTHIKKHRQLKWVLGFTSQPPGEIAAAFQPLAENLRVGRSRLLVLSGVTSPATFGWIRPTILLPDVCLEQDRSELEDILRHELHHVRRWDFVWNGFAVACRALVFFHPAAWYAVEENAIRP